jgi:hypothetical protein
MSISKIFEYDFIISAFYGKFKEVDDKKLTKYLLLIAIDYLAKYYKKKQIKFENIRDLASFF